MTDHIDIYVECYWEKSDSKYCDSGFKGGWEIVKCAGHPEINGGMGTPDMMVLFPTEQSIKDKFYNEYADRYPDQLVKVHIKITKDDRNPTMDNFFG